MILIHLKISFLLGLDTNRMLQELHNIPMATSSFDKMKKEFVSRITPSTANHRVLTSSPIGKSMKQNGDNNVEDNKMLNHTG